MPRELNLVLTPEQASTDQSIRKVISESYGVDITSSGSYIITRKSIDARRGRVMVNLGLKIYESGEEFIPDTKDFIYHDVRNSSPVIIVGAGPAGLFAALRLLESGIKPIIIERGRCVSERKVDVAKLNRNLSLNPDSNYAFGEGGAGTFSDGKLYTRSKKRGDIKKVLYILCNHGADNSILYDAHPHIGTNKLPGIISKIRKTIVDHGGEILFNSKITKILIRDSVAHGVQLSDGQNIEGKAIVLATGHSAKDVYYMLANQGIVVEAKPFAMGVRVEHPQELIDTIQYHGLKRGEYLPAASYSLVSQVDGRGVYSFCMCPGGFIVPASTLPGEVVVNGMSPTLRNSRWANSGIVVEIRMEDLNKYSRHKQFAGLKFQQELEFLAGIKGSFGVKAPAQRMADFVAGKQSANLPECSYHPGIKTSPMHDWLPKHISKRLQVVFKQFDQMMRGFLTNEAVILGVESRTSSPIRIPRDPESLQHIHIKGLFPAGEGAGYAGGIVSSAMDGEKCAEGVVNYLA